MVRVVGEINEKEGETNEDQDDHGDAFSDAGALGLFLPHADDAPGTGRPGSGNCRACRTGGNGPGTGGIEGPGRDCCACGRSHRRTCVLARVYPDAFIRIDSDACAHGYA